MMMLCTEGELLRGALDLLALDALVGSTRHAFAVAEWVKAVAVSPEPV